MKTALITGTSKGLGYALVQELLADGYRVIGVARTEYTPDGSAANAHYHHLQADVTADDYSVRLRQLIAQLGIQSLELVINNAGNETGGATLPAVRQQNLHAQFALHCVAALVTVQAVQPLLNNAKIVNITSRLGSCQFNQRGDFADRGFTYSYRIAKAAQNMLSLCMAQDQALSAHLVISLIPGLLLTDSGADDATHTAAQGAWRVWQKIRATTSSGIVHAFDDEAAY